MFVCGLTSSTCRGSKEVEQKADVGGLIQEATFSSLVFILICQKTSTFLTIYSYFLPRADAIVYVAAVYSMGVKDFIATRFAAVKWFRNPSMILND